VAAHKSPIAILLRSIIYQKLSGYQYIIDAGTRQKACITVTVILSYTLDYIFLYFCLK